MSVKFAPPEETMALLQEWNPEAIMYDGFNAAIVGVVSRCGTEPLALYDRAKCIQILMDEGCSHSDAEDYFCFNVEGCWAGPHTPMIASFNLDPVGVRYPVTDLECVADIGADAEIVFGSHITGTHDLSSTDVGSGVVDGAAPSGESVGPVDTD